MTSVGDNLDRCCYIGNRYHDDDTPDVVLIIFIAQLGYRAFKRGFNKTRRGSVSSARACQKISLHGVLRHSWNTDSLLKQNVGGYRFKGDRETETIVIQQLITRVTGC